MAKKSKGIHDIFLRTLEKIIATNFFGRIYTKFFEKMTLDEFGMAGIEKNCKVLHIGCGAVPNTLLVLAMNTDASFVGIDRDKKAVERAKDMVDRYGLGNKIHIMEGDAMSYPTDVFDVIVISLGVEPREKVFEKIRKEAKNNTKIVARKPWDFMDKIYGREEFVSRGFKIIKTFNRPDFIKSMLLVKADLE
ncbi:MAG: class I SAM-dependent methyltransferase [Candidatus Thermoplasmatota archaeon]|nr:class I SAM-dependent methyltransferase [Candidatus Thermoplasmatota archaeon]